MQKLLLIFTVFVFQFSTSAQFLDNAREQSFYPSEYPDVLNVNLDSLMLDSAITAYKNQYDVPGIATLIVKDNQIIWNKNYGQRNLQAQLPVEDTTMFLIASISKTIVATSVMQLWENGLIDLDSSINKYLPEGFIVKNPNYPNSKITVKMLMNHTSSLTDNFVFPFAICGDSPIRLDSFLVNYFTPGGQYYYGANFANTLPGQQWAYSNAGTSMLALIVETLTGKSFDEYCRDSIFTPLSMHNASWFLEGIDSSNLAIPYDINLSPTCHLGWSLYPAAFLRLNKMELLNFLSAYINKGVFNNNRILESATIDYMLQDHLGYNIYNGLTTYGLLWWHFSPFKFWGHDGSWNPGARTYMGFNPDEKCGTIWFQNSPWGNTDPSIAINMLLTSYANLYGNIYAFKPSVDKGYAEKDVDSVLFRTSFVNKNNHQFTPMLLYFNTDSTVADSLQLYDDGLHGDLLPNDGIYGVYIPPQTKEDFYHLGVSTIDNQTNKYVYTPDISRFTTIPLLLDSLKITHEAGNNKYSFIPFFKNAGIVHRLENLRVFLECNDTCVISISPRFPKYRSCPNLLPGQTASTPNFIIEYNPMTFTEKFNLTFSVQSGGWDYWKLDTKVLLGISDEDDNTPTHFSLSQNYPNPFNNISVISYSIPQFSRVIIKIFNALGEELEILINEEKNAGTYQQTWNAANLPSGVYYYQLRAGRYVKTKKMILMK